MSFKRAKVVMLPAKEQKTNITIKKVKDSWNREEVIELIKCFDRGINRPITNVNKWIEENL